MGGHFVGMIMYADDILLIAPTVLGLQTMLDKCSDIFGNIKLQFNPKKSVCVAIGAANEYEIGDMKLQNCNLAWSKMFKYLGVTFNAGKSLTMDSSNPIRKFYSSCNSIFQKTANLDEIARLHLIEAKCLPILTYALPALKLRKEQLQEMNKAWNCAYRKIFGYNMWDSVKPLICGLGKLDFIHIKLKLYINFLRNNINSNNLTLKYLMLRSVFSDSNSCDKRDSIIGSYTVQDLVLNNELSYGQVLSQIYDAFNAVVVGS